MIRRILVMLDPITLPATISELPILTDAIEEASSGRDVPKATTVTPMIKGDIPKLSPIFSAELTNQSLDLIKTNKLAIKIATKIKRSII